MKKLLCGLLVAMLSFSAFAQDYKVPRGRIDKYAGSKICKYEVRIGWGGYPLFGTQLFEHNNLAVGACYEYYMCGLFDNSVKHIYDDYYGSTYTTGSISAEFSYMFNHWLNLSFSVDDTIFWKDVYDGMDHNAVRRSYGNVVSFMPAVRFTYLSRPMVKLYSSVGLGFLLNIREKGTTAHFACQVAPIGISVGRRVFGFAEIAVGTRAMGGNFGIGYRF